MVLVHILLIAEHRAEVLGSTEGINPKQNESKYVLSFFPKNQALFQSTLHISTPLIVYQLLK